MDGAGTCHVRFARERMHVSETSTEPSSSSLAQLSYDAALRALDGQERGLEELRARTGTLLAAASLVASFLGAQTIQRTNALETIEALALIALGVSVGACTYVLLPKEGFVFSLNGISLYETLYEHRGDDAEMQRRLAYWLEGYWRANEAKISKLGTWFFAAAVGLILQLVFWTWALADTI
jgi:hypothetical protein